MKIDNIKLVWNDAENKAIASFGDSEFTVKMERGKWIVQILNKKKSPYTLLVVKDKENGKEAAQRIVDHQFSKIDPKVVKRAVENAVYDKLLKEWQKAIQKEKKTRIKWIQIEDEAYDGIDTKFGNKCFEIRRDPQGSRNSILYLVNEKDEKVEVPAPVKFGPELIKRNALDMLYYGMWDYYFQQYKDVQKYSEFKKSCKVKLHYTIQLEDVSDGRS